LRSRDEGRLIRSQLRRLAWWLCRLRGIGSFQGGGLGENGELTRGESGRGGGQKGGRRRGSVEDGGGGRGCDGGWQGSTFEPLESVLNLTVL
jgi:hypothetical protein